MTTFSNRKVFSKAFYHCLITPLVDSFSGKKCLQARCLMDGHQSSLNDDGGELRAVGWQTAGHWKEFFEAFDHCLIAQLLVELSWRRSASAYVLVRREYLERP